jgi:hypothetical protein
MTELVSGMPAPQLGDESSWVLGSELVESSRGSCISFWLTWDVLVYEKVFCVTPNPVTTTFIPRLALDAKIIFSQVGYCTGSIGRPGNYSALPNCKCSYSFIQTHEKWDGLFTESTSISGVSLLYGHSSSYLSTYIRVSPFSSLSTRRDQISVPRASS